jgi:hypothetical protein
LNKIKVILDTQSDIREFVNIANTINEEVYLEDGTGFRVNGKSLLGAMYGTSEFNDLYVLSDNQYISSKFIKFII